MARNLRAVAHGCVAAIIFTAIGGTAVVAGAAEDGGSLCDTLPLEELHGLSDLRYGEAEFGSQDFCFYEASSEQTGPHSINVSVLDAPFGMTLDDFRTMGLDNGADLVDVSVGDLAGYIDASVPDSTSLMVGLPDERLLNISVAVEASAEVGDLDVGGYVVDIAGIMAPRLKPGEGATSASASAPALPQVDGVDWRTQRELTGEQVETEGTEFLPFLGPVLDASGASIEQAAIRNAVAYADSGERLGTVLMVRIEGSDAMALRPVFVESLLRAAGGDGFTATETELGGREVIVVTDGGEQRALIHAGGDTLSVVDLPDELAASVFAALP